MAFCYQCGEKVSEEANFCGSCGFDLQQNKRESPAITESHTKKGKKKSDEIFEVQEPMKTEKTHEEKPDTGNPFRSREEQDSPVTKTGDEEDSMGWLWIVVGVVILLVVLIIVWYLIWQY